MLDLCRFTLDGTRYPGFMPVYTSQTFRLRNCQNSTLLHVQTEYAVQVNWKLVSGLFSLIQLWWSVLTVGLFQRERRATLFLKSSRVSQSKVSAETGLGLLVQTRDQLRHWPQVSSPKVQYNLEQALLYRNGRPCGNTIIFQSAVTLGITLPVQAKCKLIHRRVQKCFKEVSVFTQFQSNGTATSRPESWLIGVRSWQTVAQDGGFRCKLGPPLFKLPRLGSLGPQRRQTVTRPWPVFLYVSPCFRFTMNHFPALDVLQDPTLSVGNSSKIAE